MKERTAIAVISVFIAIVLLFVGFQILCQPPPTKSEQWIVTASDIPEINWTAIGVGQLDEHRLRMWMGSERYDESNLSDAAESILGHEYYGGTLDIVIYLFNFPSQNDTNKMYEAMLSSYAMNQTSIEQFDWNSVSIGDGGFISHGHPVGHSNDDGVYVVFAKGTAVVFMNVGWNEWYHQAYGEPLYTQFAEVQAAKIPQV